MMRKDRAFHRVVRRWLHRGSRILFLAVIALAPLPFGATAPVPLALALAGLALSLLTADLRHVTAAHLKGFWVVLAAFAAYVGMAALQHLPAAAGLVPAAPIWAEAEALLGIPLPGQAAWSASVSFAIVGAPLAGLLAFARALALSSERRGALQLFAAIAVSGAIYAVYGIAAHVLTPELLLWRAKTAYLDAVTGTFVNRNTAATYWGSCAVICLAMGLDHAAKRAGRSSVNGEASGLFRILPWIGLVPCLLALAMTGSRAGVILTLLALMPVVAISLSGMGHLKSLTMGRLALLLPGIGALLLTLGAAAVARVHVYGLYDEHRAAAYADILAMIARHPWTGVGIGAFGTVFPRFRSAELGSSGLWDRAHSTPLEIAAEAGLPVTMLIVATCLFIVYVLLKGCFERRRDRFFPVATFGCVLLGFGHSCVDFSLQIPGYAIVFASIVGCGLAQSVPTRQIFGEGGARDETTSLQRGLSRRFRVHREGAGR